MAGDRSEGRTGIAQAAGKKLIAVDPGIRLASVLPGNALPAPRLGLAVEVGTVSEGALPPLATTEPLMKFPRYQSKPSALLSCCCTSMNRDLI